MASAHSGQIERWLGPERAELISGLYRGWYGPAAPVLGLPGEVTIGGDGDFAGRMRGGRFGSLVDWMADCYQDWQRESRRSVIVGVGFSSLAQMLGLARNGGKQRRAYMSQLHGASAAGGGGSSWGISGSTYTGEAAPAAPSGAALGKTSTGAIKWNGLPSVDAFLMRTNLTSNGGALRSAIIYDRLFHVDKTMSSTSNEAVTGTPTRYNGADASGNFVFPEVSSALGATAHNWTMQYTDQDGNTAVDSASVAGVASAEVMRIDMAPSLLWYIPLAAGDHGVRAITRMTCDASVTGGISFVLGRHLACCALGLGSSSFVKQGGARSPLLWEHVHEDACITTIQFPKTTADNNISVAGELLLVHEA